jgi:hypothetical protein
MELKKNPSIMTNIEDLKEELYFFKKNYLPLENVYDLAIIGINDRIIPSNRQKKYYKKNLVQIRELDAPHYPFKVLNSWKDIID